MAVRCKACGVRKANDKQIEEHDCPGRPPSQPEQADPTPALVGLADQIKNSVESATQMPIEEAAEAVKRGELEEPMVSVRQQHLTVGQTRLPSRVRIYDDRGYQRYVRPEIAVDRVLFKGWSWPREGEPEGHRKDERWYTWGPCNVCGRSDDSDDPRGPDEALTQHQRIDHPDWWRVHQFDQQRRTNEMMAETLHEMKELQKAQLAKQEA